MTSETPTRSQAATDTFRQDRLAHVLPDFTRLSWVNDRARGVWEPRITRIGSAWAEIEWRSVVSGIRRCALTSIPSDQLILRSTEWAASGLSMMPVAMSGTSPGYASTSVAPRVGEPFEYRVAVGALADVAELKHAIDDGDDATMGQLLGFPDCCIAFFRKTWVDEGCVDTTWAMAANGGSVDESGRLPGPRTQAESDALSLADARCHTPSLRAENVGRNDGNGLSRQLRCPCGRRGPASRNGRADHLLGGF